MKKRFIVIVLIMCGFYVYAQQKPTVAVAAFDVQAGRGITQDEANVIYELFIAELASTGAVTVVDRFNLDKILAEMRFQTSDWSNKEKTASLGKALNAGIIVRGQLMKMGSQIYWIITMLDVNTAAIHSASRVQLKDMGQIWNALPGFCKQLVEKIKTTPPNVQGIPTVAVATFDVQGGVSSSDAEVVTELFITELVARNDVKVVDRVNFDKIVQEMKFQTSDWSNNNKTAALGRVLNAGVVIRGQLMKMGDNIFWTATILDVNTAQVLSSARQQLTSLDQIWGTNLTNFSQQIVTHLPPPNFFVGRWQATQKVDGRDIICVLNIKADGTVVVERYDTITETQNRTVDGAAMAAGVAMTALTMGLMSNTLFGNYNYETTYSSPNRNGTGTGSYSAIIKNGANQIRTTISLNLNGITSGISSSPRAEIYLNITSPNKLNLSGDFHTVYHIYQESGTTKQRDSRNSYGEFTRIN